MELSVKRKRNEIDGKKANKLKGRIKPPQEVVPVHLLPELAPAPVVQVKPPKGKQDSKEIRVHRSKWKTSTPNTPLVPGTRSWIHKTASDFSNQPITQSTPSFPTVFDQMNSLPQFYPSFSQQGVVASQNPLLIETLDECRQFLTKSLVTAQETNLPLTCLVACPCESFKRALRNSLDRKVNCALRARRNPVSFTCSPFPTPIYQSLFPAHATGAIRERTQTITSITHTVTNPRQLDHIFGESWDARPIRMSTDVKLDTKDDKDDEDKEKDKEKKHLSIEEKEEAHVLNGTFELMPTATTQRPQVKLCFDLDNESLSLKTKFRFVDESGVVLF